MGGQIRILVADDHPLMRSGIAAEINAEADMSVVASAGDGEEALSLFRTHRPDIALIDLRMPKMNGLEVVRELRNMAFGGKIFIFSSEIDEDVNDVYLTLKVDMVLPKPIILPELKQFLAEF